MSKDQEGKICQTMKRGLDFIWDMQEFVMWGRNRQTSDSENSSLTIQQTQNWDRSEPNKRSLFNPIKYDYESRLVMVLILTNMGIFASKICKRGLKIGWYLKTHSLHILSVWYYIIWIKILLIHTNMDMNTMDQNICYIFFKVLVLMSSYQG